MCVKVYCTHCIPLTCFGYSCGHLQVGALHRTDTLRYYISISTNAHM